jgi:DNA ligase (NAD+)
VQFSSGQLFTGSVRGEIVLKRSTWKQYFSDISNPRNGASGISRRLDGTRAEHLCFMAYDMITQNVKLTSEYKKLQLLQELGFATPNFFLCEDTKAVIKQRDSFISSLRDQLDYDIDGIVIKIDDVELQNSFGRSSGLATGNPNGQVTFKFANEMRETIVKNIIWDVGLTGRITPVAEFDAIMLSGASITRASLYNFRNVQNLGVSIGAKVLVSRRNEVIPAVEKVIQKSEVEVSIPTNCPECKKPIRIDGEYLVCANEECSAVIQGNIQKWIENIGIDGIGPQLVENLFRSGMVKRIPDLYRLKEDKLAGLDRLGDRSAAKIIKNLNARKQMPLHIFLGSLNIPGCGRRVFESLVEQGYDTIDYILSLLPAHFEQVEGVGSKTAQDIYMGLRARKQLIADLLSVGITIGPFQDVPSAPTTAAISINPTSAKGKSFCFTGAMSLPRNVLESYAIKAGGTTKSSVSSGLTYLVMADANSKTTKAVKARSLGVTTISEQDFLKMVGK